ncbi:MAG: type II toxin-antitoxin system HipA family toxin [Planctomycetes bacterium]|nr:type II toxin-antitoxin system HipA family toxin [Planctomycetota bacterium]
MSTLAEVRLWGTTIGAVLLEDGGPCATFEYADGFLASRIQVAPLTMPLGPGRFQFTGMNRATFHGLPGLLADSLPDRFGNALIDAWLESQGRAPASFNAVERLAYVGRRGMGALEFEPATGPQARAAETLEVAAMVELASAILSQRADLAGYLSEDSRAGTLKEILQVGTSAGGARAKAVIAWNPATQELRSGQVPADPGFEHWLLKFDGVSGNRDQELEDPQGYGRIEYAYHRMAADAGVDMRPCRLLHENGRSHFMTRRFDRAEGGGKLHMQTLGALAHFDFHDAGAHAYEQAFRVVRQLELRPADLEQLFLRMVFNVVARNQDDHVKNIAFLMDKRGAWSLAPAYDVIYSYQPAGAWTGSHQMSLNGKRDGFVPEDFVACGRTAGLKRGRAAAMLEEVTAVVARWPDYAEEAGVRAEQREKIRRTLRLDLA